MPLIGLTALQKSIDEIPDELNKTLRGYFFTTLQNIQIGTPVLEGRARNNWFASEGTPSSKVDNSEFDGDYRVGQVSPDDITINDIPINLLGKTLFFTNNLPYIMPLEYGWSKQAPVGWVRQEVMQLRKEVRKL